MVDGYYLSSAVVYPQPSTWNNDAMRVKAIARLLRMPDLLAQGLVLRDLQSFVRVHYLYAAANTGLLRALRRPATMRELVHDLHVKRPTLLEGLLALGVALGELSVRDGVYRLRGVRSKVLVGKRGDPLVASIEEYATYHSSVYRELGARLRGAPLGNYLRETGDMIARSSRVLEPFAAEFVRMTVENRGPVRILEVGCGSGVYLRHAALANPQASGVGIDLQPDVVKLAAHNLARWGLDARFTVIQADIRRPPVDLARPFDLATLYNNIYYFIPEERPTLFKALRDRLAPGGRLALISAMQGASVATNDLDLVLRSTAGCTALPTVAELSAQLMESGFRSVKETSLVPFESLYGLVAE
jgi:SAM-dependent methyltransferase